MQNSASAAWLKLKLAKQKVNSNLLCNRCYLSSNLHDWLMGVRSRQFANVFKKVDKAACLLPNNCTSDLYTVSV